ncbi:hypothetical protein JOQ06_008911, partial [Pogonophryne albipinna]
FETHDVVIYRARHTTEEDRSTHEGRPQHTRETTPMINREFMRITTVPLTSKFLSQLDECSDQLVKVFINKGGVAGKEIRSTIAVMDRSDDIEVRRECILKCLCTYLHEDSGKLVGEYLSSDIAEAKKKIAET